MHSRIHQPNRSHAIPDLRQFYILPISPATEPDDYEAGDDLYTDFETPWVNIGTDADPEFPPSSYSLALGGKPMYEIYATGGEAEADSLIAMIPAPFRPSVRRRLMGTVGENGEYVATIDVYPTGEMVFKGAGLLT